MRKTFCGISLVGILLSIIFAVAAEAQNISTFAGGGPTGVPAQFSAIGTPWGVVQDASGNTYFSDNLSNRVFMVDPQNNITVLAGNIVPGYSGDGGAATSASLNSPEGIAVDGAGNVYITDTGNNALRVVANPSGSGLTLGGQTISPGNIQTVVGNGAPGYSTGSGPIAANTAQLNSPGGVWLDTAGNIYIADTLNSVIEVVNTQSTTITVAGVSIPQGDIATAVGINQAGFSGDGNPASLAKISQPLGVFVDSTAAMGNIYIADTLNNRIRVVNTQATAIKIANQTINPTDILTVAGDGTEGYSGDNGSATSAELNHPSALYADASGNIYIADGDNLPPPQNVVTSNERIRKVTSSGTISTFAGNGVQCINPNNNPKNCGDGGAATGAQLWAPTGVFINGSGDLLIADQNDDAIREVVAGTISTAMGELLNTAYSGDVNTADGITGTATDASLRRPAGVASDALGNVYIADTLNNAIRKVGLNGIISTVAGTGVGCNTLTCGDAGPATAAQLGLPFQVAFDSAGNMYIADSADNAIRVVNNGSTPLTFYSGLATQITVAPGNIQAIVDRTGTICPSNPCGDGGAALSAQLNQPEGIFLDNLGNIYIADTNDNAIRVVNTQGTAMTFSGVMVQPGNIATVAGSPNPAAGCTNPLSGQCGDTGLATSALLANPGAVALDSSQNIYISDTTDNRIRTVTASTGIINAFAGTGVACQNNCGDGGPATAANLDAPQGVFVDFAGNVFIADADDFEIREVTSGTINAVVDQEQSRGYLGDGGPALTALLAVPYGVAGDPFGNLFIADVQEWRIREVSLAVTTAPRAQVSPSSIPFPGQLTGTGSSQNVTVTNNGNGTSLSISSVSNPTGTNATDFTLTNGCGSSLAAQSSCNIKVTFTPAARGNRGPATFTITDNAGGNSGAQQTVMLTGVGLSSTTTSAPTSSANPATAGSPVTFTAVVTSSGGTPSAGTVTFNDGSTALGSPAIDSSGKATLTTSSLAAGNHSITAIYSGDAGTFFAASAASSALTQVVNPATAPTFTLPSTGTLGSPSLSAGGQTTATVSITPQGGFSSAITLTCSVSPAPSLAPGCSLNPSQLTPKGSGAVTSTLTVTTTAATASLVAPEVRHRSAPVYAFWLLLPAMLLGGAGISSSSRKKVVSYVLLAVALSGLVFLVACGGGSSSGNNGGGGGTSGTPSGNYVITVKATSGTISQTQTFPLTVQ